MNIGVCLAITLAASLAVTLIIALTPLWPSVIAVFSIIGLVSWLYISSQSRYTFTPVDQAIFCITVATISTFLIVAAWPHWQAYLRNKNGNGRTE